MNHIDVDGAALFTMQLVRISREFREYCCEFSKFLNQDEPFEYWPDAAEQLLFQLDDVETCWRTCRDRLNPLTQRLIRTVAELSLTRPDGQLSWSIWVLEHWGRLRKKATFDVSVVLGKGGFDDQFWFQMAGNEARNQPDRCKEIASVVIGLGEYFHEFDEVDDLLRKIRLEFVGVGLNGIQDYPITMSALYKLCRKKKNRAGVVFAKSDSTIRGWKQEDDWPEEMTWNTVRDWVNRKKDYDIGDPYIDPAGFR